MPLNNPITSALLADPEIFQQNRLPFHAHFADQTSPELPLTVSLDGEWNFRYAENLTAPFTDWDTLTVPGFIQMQSLQKPGQPYGTPHYVNTQYPWDGHEKLRPGEIPQDYNPIGEYQRSFTLPESWDIEVKYAKEMKNLDAACEAAMTQIKEKRYDEALRDEGRCDILAYGIAFCRKRCRVVGEKIND